MLPTNWETANKGLPALFITSQVQDRYLYCVYRIPTEGGMINASVHRLIPKGVKCISDGAGRFECRSNGRQN
ncbi:MAG: hypothetical protein GXP52_05565 [Deltaproteobacteria bacterium]|nr:hypothetical protein [Deltaproteobacteria bacterium]